MQYRKKPIVIEAVQYHLREYADNPLTFDELPDWLTDAVNNGTIKAEFRGEDYWYLVIKTLEGDMDVTPNDWIIRGIEGELYPCKPAIFAATYEPVTPRATPGSPAAAWPIGTPVWYRRYGDGPWEQSTTKTVPWTTANGITWVTVESTPAQAGAALTLGGLRTLDNPPPDTELEPPTTPL